jgi:hypothetical protein
MPSLQGSRRKIWILLPYHGVVVSSWFAYPARLDENDIITRLAAIAKLETGSIEDTTLTASALPRNSLEIRANIYIGVRLDFGKVAQMWVPGSSASGRWLLIDW